MYDLQQLTRLNELLNMVVKDQATTSEYYELKSLYSALLDNEFDNNTEVLSA